MFLFNEQKTSFFRWNDSLTGNYFITAGQWRSIEIFGAYLPPDRRGGKGTVIDGRSAAESGFREGEQDVKQLNPPFVSLRER